jgi:hypothetical protein
MQAYANPVSTSSVPKGESISLGRIQNRDIVVKITSHNENYFGDCL